ncbi:MAG: DUF535 domain-containing protein [Chitinophagaceae bacterium]|jgi:uncharacterized protein VirK/YbjX|nr:MAG: DUF535 domain-containing protein [Chitinophagaceae bacterium]
MLPTATLASKLAAKAFAKEDKKYRRKQQYKSFFQAFIYSSFASKWFQTLYSPEFNLIAEHRPRLYFKPFRVYMSAKWSKNRRVKVILDTYRFIRSRGGCFMQVVTDEKQTQLAIFKLKDGSEASLSIGYDERYRKEGELVLFFQCEQLGGFITGVSFSFEKSLEEEGWVCRIGCIQGHKNNDENLIKAAQNLMNGLRPKSLMVFAVKELAANLGVQLVFGAGQSIQAYRKKHAIHIRWLHKIHFDYNKLWIESGGKLKEDGWYLLPIITPRKNLDEIKSCKRALYRRRYQMMDEIAQEISKSIQCLTVPVQ